MRRFFAVAAAVLVLATLSFSAETTPAVTVTSPKSGDTLVAGSTYTIKWDSSLPAGASVSIQLSYRNAGSVSNVEDMIAGPIENTGSYSWTVPSAYAEGKEQGMFSLRVIYSGTDGRVLAQDYSDYFSIIPGSCPADIDLVFTKKTYYVEDSLELVVYIRDSSGKAMPNHAFVVKNNRDGAESTYNTDSDGLYTYKTTVPSDTSYAGDWTFTVYTEQKGSCASVADSETIRFDITEKPAVYPAKIDLQFDKQTYNIGETLEVKVVVYDANNMPIPNQQFYVKIEGNDYTSSLYTGADGMYKVTSTAPSVVGVWTYIVYVIQGSGITATSITDTETIYTINPSSVTCTDSDGGKDYYTKGTTVGMAADGVISTDTDSCRDSTWLVEWVCLDEFNGAKNVYRSNENYQCPHGCKDGACLKPAENETAAPSKIDLQFNKRTYYYGDMIEVKVYVYDAKGKPVPNQPFSVKNNRDSSVSSYRTDSAGMYSTSFGVPADPSYVGDWIFTAYIAETNRNYISDSETITVLPSAYPGFFMETDKDSYAPGDTVTLKIRRADSKNDGYSVDLYAAESASYEKVMIQSKLVAAPNVEKKIKLSDWKLFSKAGYYLLILCDSGKECKDYNTNSIGFYIEKEDSPGTPPDATLRIITNTDKYSYGLGEAVKITANAYGLKSDLDDLSIKAEVSGPGEIVTLPMSRDSCECRTNQVITTASPRGIITGKVAASASALSSIVKKEIEVPASECSCTYSGTFYDTNAIGFYRVWPVLSSSNPVVEMSGASFQVVDASMYEKYLIKDVEGYELKGYGTSSIGDGTAYMAKYEKGAANYIAGVAVFDSREKMMSLLDEALRQNAGSVRKDTIDGYPIYVFETSSDRVSLWTNDNLLVIVAESKGVAMIAAETKTEIAQTETASKPSLFTGMVVAKPTLAETPQGALPLIRAYLDKYPSDLEASGTRCEKAGGYCVSSEASCRQGYSESQRLCEANAKCCLKQASTGDILQLTMKLDALRNVFRQMQNEASALSRYYDSVGDNENSKKYAEVSGMFGIAADKTAAILNKIRNNVDNMDDPDLLADIKQDMQSLKDYIKEIIKKIIGAPEAECRKDADCPIQECPAGERCLAAVCEKGRCITTISTVPPMDK